MDRNNQGGVGRTLPWVQCLLGTAALFAVLVPAAVPASAASGAERSLAGVSIFAPGSLVTRKFGNPSQILVGGVAPVSGTAATGPGGAPGGAPGGFPGGAGAPGGFPGGAGAPGGGAGQLPGFPGISGGGFPGAPAGFPGQASGAPGAPGAVAAVKPAVTLVYNRANGGTLEFTISPDKRVVQVRETGYSGAYATSRGIRLGMPYSAVIARYGYPENTDISGSVINIDYKDTLHCGFQFLDQKLVGIIVASPD